MLSAAPSGTRQCNNCHVASLLLFLSVSHSPQEGKSAYYISLKDVKTALSLDGQWIEQLFQNASGV
jgi:hypothetical protein